MENKEIDLIELFNAVWAKRKLLVKWGLIGMVVGVVIAFSIPKTYQSVVKIASESKSSSRMGSMGGLAAMAGISFDGSSDNGISEQVYPEVLKSTPFLLDLAPIKVDYDNEKISFYDYITKNQKKAWWSYVMSAPMKFVGWVMSIGKDNKPKDEAINIFEPSGTQLGYIGELNKLIKTSTDKKTDIMSIEVKMQDPYIAAIIADSVLARLQLYMTNYRTSKARADLKNNEKLLNEVREKYYILDSAYANAQDRNRNLAMKSAQVQLERLSNEKDLAFSIYQQVANQVEMGRIKVQEETPIATVIEPASVAKNPISPNKMIVVLAFIFLSVFGIAAVQVVKFIIDGR